MESLAPASRRPRPQTSSSRCAIRRSLHKRTNFGLAIRCQLIHSPPLRMASCEYLWDCALRVKQHYLHCMIEGHNQKDSSELGTIKITCVLSTDRSWMCSWFGAVVDSLDACDDARCETNETTTRNDCLDRRTQFRFFPRDAVHIDRGCFCSRCKCGLFKEQKLFTQLVCSNPSTRLTTACYVSGALLCCNSPNAQQSSVAVIHECFCIFHCISNVPLFTCMGLQQVEDADKVLPDEPLAEKAVIKLLQKRTAKVTNAIRA